MEQFQRSMLIGTMPSSSRILPHLYQGAQPPRGATLASNGFHVVVLCASEYQPASEDFWGVRVIRCPFNDSFTVPLTFAERRMIGDTVSRVVRELRCDRRVYISCHAGINRSGLVTALVVRELTGCNGKAARRWVQAQRPGSLSNPRFRAILDALEAP